MVLSFATDGAGLSHTCPSVPTAFSFAAERADVRHTLYIQVPVSFVGISCRFLSLLIQYVSFLVLLVLAAKYEGQKEATPASFLFVSRR